MTEPRPDDSAPSPAHRFQSGSACGLFVDGVRRAGTVWRISVSGVHVALPEPLPVPDTRVVLTFSLPGERRPIAAEGRIRAISTLPPGCDVDFVALDAADRERIAACMEPHER